MTNPFGFDAPPQVEHGPLQDPATSLSKRAARRIVQRTFVLLGKDKVLRQHIREAHITTLWLVEDWELEWTVILHRGKFEFERRPAKRPDITLSWPTAEDFFRQVDHSRAADAKVEITAPHEHRRLLDTLLHHFFSSLREVLANPVDALGESLL